VIPACPTGKIAFAKWETAALEARRLRLRAYRCPRCDGFHLTRRRKLRPRYMKISARECEAVWSL
jgi:hypothetical protein